MADVGRESEIRYLGEIDSAPAAVERIIGKLAGRYSMPIHTRPRLAGIGDDLSITRGGTDGLHDSPLEGGGFEPSAFYPESSVSAAFRASPGAYLHPYPAPVCTPFATVICNPNLCT